MKYRIAHTTRYRYQGAVPIGYNRVCLSPRRSAHQKLIRAQLEISPAPAYMSERVEDFYGNEIHYFCVQSPHTSLEITGHSEVVVSPRPAPDAAGSLPWESVREMLIRTDSVDLLDAYQFVFGAEPPEVRDELLDFVAPSFPAGTPLLAGAVSLMGRIHNEFTYDPSATTISTPIAEVLTNRRGVCQDFAHLQIACMRALGLSAKYVSGYIAPKRSTPGAAFVGAQASHAWLSIFSPGQGWVDLDPTNDVLPSTDHVTLAWGRDYHEVSPVRGVILGGGAQQLEVSVNIVRLEMSA